MQVLVDALQQSVPRPKGAAPITQAQSYAYKKITQSHLFDAKQENYRRSPFFEYLGQYLHHLGATPTGVAPKLRFSTSSKDVMLYSLAEAYQIYPEVVKKYFFSSPFAKTDACALMNSAFFLEGILVYVKKGTTSNLLHIYFEAQREPSYPRLLVYLEEDASLTLVEHYESEEGEATYQNNVSEIVCSKGAQLCRYQLQQENQKALRVDHSYIFQEEESRIQHYTFSSGAKALRNNLYVQLHGRGAEAALYGLTLCTEQAHIDQQTTLRHRAHSTHSRQEYRAVAAQSGTSIFNGRIYMEQAALQSTSYQSSKNLLIDSHARIYAKPQLEIFADDVKCSHGCTIGQLDETHRFYLQSRGLSEQAATHLLLEAFAEDLVASVEHQELQSNLREWIAKLLLNIGA